jgi:hypothetical protein
MTDLSEKPCRCGETMGEVIGFQERVTDGKMVKYRVCWYCPECHASGKSDWQGDVFVEIIHDKLVNLER